MEFKHKYLQKKESKKEKNKNFKKNAKKLLRFNSLMQVYI